MPRLALPREILLQCFQPARDRLVFVWFASLKSRLRAARVMLTKTESSQLQRKRAFCFFLLISLCLAAPLAVADDASSAGNASPASPESVDFFERKIRPVLVERCF